MLTLTRRALTFTPLLTLLLACGTQVSGTSTDDPDDGQLGGAGAIAAGASAGQGDEPGGSVGGSDSLDSAASGGAYQGMGGSEDGSSTGGDDGVDPGPSCESDAQVLHDEFERAELGEPSVGGEWQDVGVSNCSVFNTFSAPFYSSCTARAKQEEIAGYEDVRVRFKYFVVDNGGDFVTVAINTDGGSIATTGIRVELTPSALKLYEGDKLLGQASSGVSYKWHYLELDISGGSGTLTIATDAYVSEGGTQSDLIVTTGLQQTQEGQFAMVSLNSPVDDASSIDDLEVLQICPD
jgi:hypothetical protein